MAATGVKLPPDGEPTPTIPPPDKYRCTAKLAGRPLKGHGTACTFTVAEEPARQAPFVAVTAHYEGATKTVQLQYRAGGIR